MFVLKNMIKIALTPKSVNIAANVKNAHVIEKYDKFCMTAKSVNYI